MSEPNPYAPPIADLDPPASGEVPEFKLYSPGQAALAAFLGTPAAGLYLVSVNRRRLGKDASATNTLIVGLFTTAALLVAAFLLPDALGRVLPIAALVAVAQYAKQDAPAFNAHLSRGGKKESSWKAAGIGVASMVVVLAVAVGVGLAVG
jgi:hypothetical protein